MFCDCVYLWHTKRKLFKRAVLWNLKWFLLEAGGITNNHPFSSRKRKGWTLHSEEQQQTCAAASYWRYSLRFSCLHGTHVTTVFQHESWPKLTRNKTESDVFRNEVMAYFYFLTPGKWLTLEQTVTCLDWFSVSTATWFYVIEHVMRLTK